MSEFTEQLIEEAKEETRLYRIIVDAILDTKVVNDASHIRKLAREILSSIIKEA